MLTKIKEHPIKMDTVERGPLEHLHKANNGSLHLNIKVEVEEMATEDGTGENYSENRDNQLLDIPSSSFDPHQIASPEIMLEPSDDDSDPDMLLVIDEQGCETSKILNASQSEMKCQNCSFTTDNADQYKIHLEKFHLVRNQTNLSCNKCDTLFSSFEEYRTHIQEKLFFCNCTTTPFDCKQLKQHSCDETIINRNIEFKCNYCDETFSAAYFFNLHKKNHYNMVQCEGCQKFFATSCLIRFHNCTPLVVASADGKCPLCQELCPKSDLMAHMEGKHRNYIKSNKNPMQIVIIYENCPLCQELFKKNELIKHMESYHRNYLKMKQMAPMDALKKSGPILIKKEDILSSIKLTEQTANSSILNKNKDFPTLLKERTDGASVFTHSSEHSSVFTHSNKHSSVFAAKNNTIDFETDVKLEPADEYEDSFETKTEYDANSENMLVQSVIKDEPESDEYEDDIIILNGNKQLEEVISKIEIEEHSVADNISVADNDTNEIGVKSWKGKKMYHCKRCNFTAFHEDYKIHCWGHMKKDLMGKYVCGGCNETFRTKSLATLHSRILGHKKISPINNKNYSCIGIKCAFCNKSLTSTTQFKSHINQHTSAMFIKIMAIDDNKSEHVTYQCKKCKTNIKKADLYFHLTTHPFPKEQSQEKTICSTKERSQEDGLSENSIECNNKSALKNENLISDSQLSDTIELLMSPLKSKKPLQAKVCKICNNRPFVRIGDLKRHLIEHLLVHALCNKMSNKGFMRCQICSEDLTNDNSYKKHMREHSYLPIYQCHLCNRSFSDSSNFTKHKKVHNLNVLMCDLCSKKFTNKLMLAQHLEAHNKAQKVYCQFCDKMFHFHSHYLKHLKLSHSNKEAQRYWCRVCNMHFKSLKLKWDHMWDQHGERKYIADCIYCDAKFRKYHNVKAHISSVHGRSTSLGKKKYLKYVSEIRSKVNDN